MIDLRIVLPGLAERETRSASTIAHDDVEESLVFDEVYCTDSACDCQRVLIKVLSFPAGSQVATISHAFPGGRADSELGRTFLDPINIQTRRSRDILVLFKEHVFDDKYEARLRDHYAQFKKAVADPYHPCQAALRKAGVEMPSSVAKRIEPYAPCPCGSGKKFRFCCDPRRK